MPLTDKLRNLDQKFLPGTRADEEDAESYLRRVAAGRAISPAQAGDVMAALRQYFGVQEGENTDTDTDTDTDDAAEGEDAEEQSDEPRDESEDESGDDESESDDGKGDDDGKKEDDES